MFARRAHFGVPQPRLGSTASEARRVVEHVVRATHRVEQLRGTAAALVTRREQPGAVHQTATDKTHCNYINPYNINNDICHGLGVHPIHIYLLHNI